MNLRFMSAVLCLTLSTASWANDDSAPQSKQPSLKSSDELLFSPRQDSPEDRLERLFMRMARNNAESQAEAEKLQLEYSKLKEESLFVKKVYLFFSAITSPILALWIGLGTWLRHRPTKDRHRIGWFLLAVSVVTAFGSMQTWVRQLTWDSAILNVLCATWFVTGPMLAVWVSTLGNRKSESPEANNPAASDRS